MNKRDADRKRKQMRQCVAAFQKYVATYTDQLHYYDYSEKTYLDDMLYGIGLSCMWLKPSDFAGPGGYERFKRVLLEHLQPSRDTAEGR